MKEKRYWNENRSLKSLKKAFYLEISVENILDDKID